MLLAWIVFYSTTFFAKLLLLELCSSLFPDALTDKAAELQ